MVTPPIDRRMGRVIPCLCCGLKGAYFLQHRHLCVFLMSRHNLLSILPWPTGKGWYYSTFCCSDPRIFCFWQSWPIPVKINKSHWKSEEIGQKREKKRSALPSEVNSGRAWPRPFLLLKNQPCIWLSLPSIYPHQSSHFSLNSASGNSSHIGSKALQTAF